MLREQESKISASMPSWISAALIGTLSRCWTPGINIEVPTGAVIKVDKTSATARLLWHHGYRFPGQILFDTEGNLASVDSVWERLVPKNLAHITLRELIKG